MFQVLDCFHLISAASEPTPNHLLAERVSSASLARLTSLRISIQYATFQMSGLPLTTCDACISVIIAAIGFSGGRAIFHPPVEEV